MTKLEQAARQALDLLSSAYVATDFVWKRYACCAALREALAEPTGKQSLQVDDEPVAWKNAAIRLGEELSSVGPDGYYDMTAQQWLDWAMDQQPQGKNSLPITPKPAAQMPHYSNTDNPVDFPKLGCVNHDCDKCQAKHQEELNKFAEDSVWDGEGP